MKSTDSLTGSMPCTPPSKTININRENRVVTKEKMCSSAASGQTDPPREAAGSPELGLPLDSQVGVQQKDGSVF